MVNAEADPGQLAGRACLASRSTNLNSTTKLYKLRDVAKLEKWNSVATDQKNSLLLVAFGSSSCPALHSEVLLH